MLETRTSLDSTQGAASRNWTLDDIAWGDIDGAAVAANEDLFFMMATASFVETMADLYTDHLVDHFAGEEPISAWLQLHWQKEELQHGAALRRYVETVWPDFDWERAYAGFLEEYGAYCKPGSLEPARSLEMVARCVVEMGTASYYTTISRLSPDPVLADLAGRIATDEVRHYKNFYHYFRAYRTGDKTRRIDIADTLWRRLRSLDGRDGFIATKHVFLGRHPDRTFDERAYREVRRRSKPLVKQHFPYLMSVRMLLKPLALGRNAQRLAVPTVTMLARRLVP